MKKFQTRRFEEEVPANNERKRGRRHKIGKGHTDDRIETIRDRAYDYIPISMTKHHPHLLSKEC